MEKMNIGFTTVTFRKKTVEQIIAAALKNEVFFIEWGGDVHVPDVRTAKSVARACRENGVTVTSLGSYYRFGAPDMPDFREVCERTAALGADRVRTWLGIKPSAEYNEDETAFLRDEVAKAADIAAGYGVSLAFEFHRKTLNDNGDSSARFLSRCHAGVSTYWQPFFEGNDDANLNAVKNRVSAAHVFSWNAACERFPLEKEKSRWEKWIAELKKSPCRDLIIEFVKDDSDEAFEADVGCLKRLTK